MKKIHLAILLAASLNLANAYVIPTYHDGDPAPNGTTLLIPPYVSVYGSPLGVSSRMAARDDQLIPDGKSAIARSYTIHNYSSTPISGFKFYHYFNAPPSKHFKAKVYQYFHGDPRIDRAAVMKHASIQPRSIKIKRLSAVQYRVELDYSNTDIPGSGNFPSVGAFYIRIESTDANAPLDNVSEWARPGHELSGFAITSKSGTVLYGPELNNNGTKVYPTVDNARRVGLLTDDPELCQNEKAYSWIMMDTEDNNPYTHFMSSPRPYGISIYPNGNLGFSYCAQAFTSMPKVAFDYVVLKMDTTCPSGSYEFARIHDTENNNNNDTHTGDIWPSIAEAGLVDMSLEYCLVTKNTSSTKDYPVNKNFSVFAKVENNSNISQSFLYIDDEDSDNHNDWDWRDMSSSSSMQQKVNNIIFASGIDTKMYAIKWIGGGLAKSEAKVVMDNKSATTTEISHAPAIRGFDHSAVSVELQSAGYAKVTIANAKGAVVAKIVKEGLQPGVHQIEWNSGIVPNGIYVVTVEHNGKIAAKNVILR